MAVVAARVIETVPLSAAVQRLVLELEGAELRWDAGQHVRVSLPGNDSARLPYSVACARDSAAPQSLELAVALNVDSAPLHSAQVGERLFIDGPHGRFVRTASDAAHVLLVGVGTGVAPLRALLQDALSSADGPAVTLLAGFRTQTELLWDAELRALAERHARFRYLPTLSRPEPGWAGREGYVQAHLAEAVRGASPLEAFVCGSKHMAAEVVPALSALGLEAERLHVEAY